MRSERTAVRLAEGYRVKALVVDDVAENRDLLGKLLRSIGVEVELADDGQQALDKTRVDLPDIVFMDIRMPVMDGITAAEQMWEEFDRTQLKIVCVSASTLAHERERYLSLGFDGFISKPFYVNQIYDCLARLLLVEYTYVSETVDEVTDFDPSLVYLSQDLHKRLVEVAELYNFTMLTQNLEEMARLGADAARLATHLRQFVANYDMDKVLEILGEVDHEPRN